MWGSRSDREEKTVVCIACGTSLRRSEAREYDKRGDRWSRRGKAFEHLCKECYRNLCHQPRDELEDLLVEVAEAGAEAAESTDDSRAAFIARYCAAVEERYGSAEGPES